MKFCDKVCDYLYVGYNGDCTLCSWMNVYIGNLADEKFEDIWQNEKAQKIREAMRKGDFKYCTATSCPHLENDSLPDLSEEEIEKKFKKIELKRLDLAYDRICNHSCPSCRDGIFVPSEEEHERYKKINEQVLSLMNKDLELMFFSGAGDIFASKYAVELARKFKQDNKNCIVNIQSNGVLFDEKHWKQIEHLREYDLRIAITPNSYNRANYMYLNGGHDTFERLLENLVFIKSLREKKYIKEYTLSIVVQERNFNDLPEFIDRSINEFGCDKVIVRPIYNWFFMNYETYWFKDILNPLHPYHKEYLKILNSDIMSNPKVYLWGAKNLHEPAKHPAYRYKDYVDHISYMLLNKNWASKLKEVMSANNADDVIIYGENEITPILYDLLKKNNIKVRFLLARDFCEGCNYELDKVSIHNYKSNKNDFVIIANYEVRHLIERDIYFNGFDGNLYDVAQLNEMFR